MTEYYSWVPFYKELAAALLSYRSRQDDLIELLQQMQEQGYPVVSLQDKRPDNSTLPVSVMDPFTFFSSFNRGISVENRRAITEELKQHFLVDAPAPEDFRGIPVTNNFHSRFFGWSYERSGDDIPALWDIAESTVHAGKVSDLNGDAFNRAMKVDSVGTGKLTMGLFWMRPDLFMPLDSKSRAYLSAKGFETGINAASDYVRLLEEVQTQIKSGMLCNCNSVRSGVSG